MTMRPQISLGVFEKYKFLLLDSTAGVAFLFSSTFSTALDVPAERIAAEYSTHAVVVIKEFRRFLAIKLFTSDTDGKKIGPTLLTKFLLSSSYPQAKHTLTLPLVDAIWSVAVLNTRFYNDLQSALGLTLHYQAPVVNLTEQEAREKEQRLSIMEDLYKSQFNFQPLVHPHTILPGGATRIFYLVLKSVNTASHPHNYDLKVTLATTVKDVKNLLGLDSGLAPNTLKLFFNGQVLDNHQDLLLYRIRPAYIVHFTTPIIRL